MAACGKLDAVKVDPAMLPSACHPVYLAVGQHINSDRVLVVVEVEDHSLVGAAVTGQREHRVSATAADQTAYDAE
jgi:hypothetical protein